MIPWGHDHRLTAALNHLPGPGLMRVELLNAAALERPLAKRGQSMLTARCHRSRRPSDGSTRAERRPASPAASTAAPQVSTRAIG